MSTQPAMPLSSAVLPPAYAPAHGKSKVAGVSLTGMLLFVMSLLVIASGFSNLRPEIAGLLLHPYLVPVGLAMPFVFLARLQDFPFRILVAMTLFTAMYSYSAFNGGSLAMGEVFKTASSVVTIITCALLVRRRGDMVAGALGLSIAVAALAVNGLKDPAHGVAAIQGANKNSYSVFALPALLMAGYIALRMKSVPVWIKSIFVVSMVPALVAIFMSGNRSGYLCAVLVGLMLFWDRRGKGLLLVAAITAAVSFWIVEYGTTKVLDEKLKQTMEGYAGDDVRRDILWICLEVGLENPILGISPQTLPFEIGKRISVVHQYPVLEAHNIFAHIFAASGLICMAAMIAVGWTMYAWKPRDSSKVSGNDDPVRDARRLIRMMVILWVARGMFTRDILFNPSFNIALGLAIGLCMIAEVERNESEAANRRQLAAFLPR